MLCCVVLYCTVLYGIELYCSALHCIVYSFVLCCMVCFCFDCVCVCLFIVFVKSVSCSSAVATVAAERGRRRCRPLEGTSGEEHSRTPSKVRVEAVDAAAIFCAIG